MSCCDKLHLEGASVRDLLQELERAGKEITALHIAFMKEIIEEYEK